MNIIKILSAKIDSILRGDNGCRLRVRRVDEEALVRACVERVAEKPDLTLYVQVWEGGSVCNSYGYPAHTEAVGVAAVRRNGNIYWRVGGARIPANKATQAGAAEATLGGDARTLFDGRCSRETKNFARGLLRDDVVENPDFVVPVFVEE